MDIRTLMAAKSKEPLTVNVEGMGEISFIAISALDRKEAEAKYPDAEDRGYYLLWKMLNGTCPELTLEEVQGWSTKAVNVLIGAIFEKLDFRVKN